MDRHDGVIVNVDNPRVGMGALGYLVDIVLCGQAGPNVDELPDTVVVRKGAHGPHEIIAVVDGQPAGPWYQLVQFHARYAVGLKVVVAAEIVVVHADQCALLGSIPGSSSIPFNLCPFHVPGWFSANTKHPPRVRPPGGRPHAGARWLTARQTGQP